MPYLPSPQDDEIQLKIISDGTTWGTKIIDEATGRRVRFVSRIEWTCDATTDEYDPRTQATIEVLGVSVEMEQRIKSDGVSIRELFGEVKDADVRSS